MREVILAVLERELHPHVEQREREHLADALLAALRSTQNADASDLAGTSLPAAS